MELISRMIQNTRNRLENHAGRPFLVWGYTTVGIALLNYWFNIAGCHPAWCFTWFLIPIIGCLLMRLFPDKKPTEPRTEIDRIVGKVWLVSSLSLIPIFLFSLFHGLSYRHSLFERITSEVLATALTRSIVSVSDVEHELKQAIGKDEVLNVELSGLGGERNLQLVIIPSPTHRLNIAKRVRARASGEIYIEDAITVDIQKERDTYNLK
jgi:hypothetical protein